MKIVWVNPSFLDYRVPLYQKIFDKTEGNFSVIFSESRMPERVFRKIKSVLGTHAVACPEKKIKINSKTEFANHGITIPIPSGLFRKIKNEKADIIIAEGFFQWTPWALFESVRNKIPLIISYERTLHTERNCPAWRSGYRKLVNRWVSGYLINGIETRKYLLSLGIQKPCADKVMCADSAFLAEQCAKISPTQRKLNREKIGMKRSDALLFFCSARLIELKGIEYLLHAWMIHSEKYPGDHLMIAGDGPLRDHLHAVSKSADTIHLLGAVDYDAQPILYASADVFILPTLEDNWSLVVPEAMACGLPVATSVYNGCHANLIQNGKNGIVFDPLNQDSLLETLEFFHLNSMRLKEMGNLSREIEQEYSPDKAAERIVRFCEQIRSSGSLK